MRILFIELLGGIGDLVIALPAIKALAIAHPNSQVTVLTFAPGGELLEKDPLIHEVIYAKQARQAVVNTLRQQDYNLIVSDTNYDGIADIVGNSSAKRTVTNLWRNPPNHQLVSDRFLQILLEEGLITPNAILNTQPLIHLLEAEKAEAKQIYAAAYRPLIFLIPDTGMPIKRWSKENFVEGGKALQQQYSATIIVPVGNDQDFTQQLVQEIGGTAQVWQRRSLRELAAGLIHADLVITVDTGPARIAAALNVPTITLFGSSWSDRYGQPSPHINLQGYPQCPERGIRNFTQQSCWYSGVCPFEWSNCTEAISAQQVLLEAAKLLQEQQDNSLEPIHPHFSSEPEINQWRNIRNILVLRLDNIGDVVMTTPALRAIKENLPDAKITLLASLTGALTAPLLPWVNEVLSWRVLWQDLGNLNFDSAREWELIETLRQRQFDAAIILTSFSQSPHPAALACYLAGIPLRLGESKELGVGVLTHPVAPLPDEVHQVERNLHLIEFIGFKVRDRQLCLQIPNTILLPYPYILLNPWTTCQSRTYDERRFAVAARQLAQITGLPIVVTGTIKDGDRAHLLLDLLGECAINLIGSTSLAEFATLISHAQLLLTNNTSAMHIADATNTPSVILFAGTEWECQWQPRYAPTILLRRPTVCNPCYTFTCPYKLQCLDIPPEEVVAAGLKLIGKYSSFQKNKLQ